MHLHTKFARLSRQAMTSQHGRLLQESGFTKQDCQQSISNSLARTITPVRIGSFYPSGTRTGRWSSGRPAMQSIPRTAGRSTSAQAFREIASMYSTEEIRAALSSALQKIYSQPTKLEPVVLLSATPLWAHSLGNTLSRFSRNEPFLSSYGSTLTELEKRLDVRSQSNYDLWALSHKL